MNRLLFLLLFCLLSQISWAQNRHQIDSLNSLLLNTHEVNEKIDAYLQLAERYHRIDLDTASQFANSALQLSINTGFEKAIADAHFHLGTIAVKRDSLDLALSAYNEAIEYYKKGRNYRELCDAYVITGNIHLTKGDYPTAMEEYLEVSRLLDIFKYETKRPHVHNNLANVYFRMGDDEQALSHFTRAYHLFAQHKDSMNMAIALSNLGALYGAIDESSTSKSYYLQALELYNSIHHHRGIVSTLSQLSSVYIKQGEPDSALQYLEVSLEMYHNIGYEFFGPRSTGLANILSNLAQAHYLKGDYKKAIEYGKESFQIGYKTKQNQILKDNSGQLSTIYESYGNIDSSFKYFRLYKSYSDSIINESNINKLSQIELQYQLDQQAKEKELEMKYAKLQERRKNLIYFIVFVILLFGLLIFILLFRLEKVKKTKIETDHRRLQQEVEFKNKELTTHMLYALKKNELMLNLAEKLKKVIPQIKVQNKKPIADIIRELDDGSADTIWEEFELRFQQVHTSFFENLSKAYPDLTANELRMCAFLRLNMSTKEIVSITYQSIKSVEMVRFRLRKKLNLHKEDNLTSFLNQF